MSQQNLYITSVAFVLLAFFFSLSRRTLVVSSFLFMLYTLSGLVYIFVRYYNAFPMTPLYLGTAAAAPFLALFGFLSIGFWVKVQYLLLFRALCILIFIVSLSQLFFPKDFYLPFLKTATFFSHMH
ncbi:MAG: hypothetical protein LBF22_05125, partial [Deltaproteobacteria bacterium]|nr:hypothetical protein [Deltaproteobacteria bacterium]